MTREEILKSFQWTDKTVNGFLRYQYKCKTNSWCNCQDCFKLRWHHSVNRMPINRTLHEHEDIELTISLMRFEDNSTNQ